MAKTSNIFINSRMDTDTHRSLLDNKSYRDVKNMRPIGEGDDGTLKFMKGSELVSQRYTEAGMQCVGMYEGDNNKLYYFLAHSNGKSKIVEYDTVAKTDRLIIEDTKVLRFDLIRWNNGVEIFPYKYLLSVDQVGDNLVFSDEVWENIRYVNLKRLSDYSAGFTEQDIMLAKKPPLKAPIILDKTFETDTTDKEENNKFISFAYRYKYVDGQYSTLSFYSDVAFQTKDTALFSVNSERLNTAMVNTIEAVTLMVDAGSKEVTDIEVYAREHGSNVAYLIYSVNKKIGDGTNPIADHSLISNIKYSFSTNYPVLDEASTKMLYSNYPKHPKTQTVAGSRLLWANYKEGFDIDVAGGVNFNTRKKVVAPSGSNNTTAVSMFKYKVGVVYLNDYNESTTPLLPIDQSKAEIQTKFNDRMYRNLIEVTDLTPPPSWATKMKFVVKSDELNYEVLYPQTVVSAGDDVFIKLNENDVNKLKVGDTILPISSEQSSYIEFVVLEVRTFSVEEGFVPTKGLYARFKNESGLVVQKNEGSDKDKKYSKKGLVDIEKSMLRSPERFISTSYDADEQRIDIPYSDFGIIKAGNTVNLSFGYRYTRHDSSDVNREPDDDFSDNQSMYNFKFTFYADKDYSNIGDLIAEKLFDYRFNVNKKTTLVSIDTNAGYAEFVKTNTPNIYNWKPYRVWTGFPPTQRSWNLEVYTNANVSLTQGNKPILFRTKNQELINEFYFETTKDYPIINGEYIGDYTENGQPVFEIGFYNGYCWGNGIESYKVKDAFNAKKLHHNFRGTAVLKDGYKRTHRPYDITYGGIYNYELGINDLGVFNASLANWKTLPFQYGAIQRIISTDSDITVFMPNKVINLLYGKSLIMDLRGNESLGLSNEVLGDYQVLPYEFGISYNPESVATASNLVYFTDKQRSRILMKAGSEIHELNAPQSGKHKDYVDMLKKHSSFLGSYDDAHGEFVLGVDNKFSIIHSITSKGFPFETENKFDFLLGMNGRYFTAYKGKIYENEVTEDYNNFAGQGNFQGSLTYVVNQQMDSDKVFKAMQIQSNTAWNTEIKTNLTATQFSEYAYQKRESYYYTDIFRDSSTMLGLVGAGIITDIQDNTIIFKNKITNQISVGESLVNENQNYQSEITAIIKNTITVSNASGFNIGDFVVGQKKQLGSFRPNGVPIRGKWMEVTLSKCGSEPYYISAVYTEVIKSQLT